MKFLLGNWQAAGALFLVLVIGGYVGVLHAQIAGLRNETIALRKDLETKITTITPADLQKLRNSIGDDIDRTVGGVRERIKLLEDRPNRTVVERTVERQTGPAGAKGPPGAPGRPGETIRGPAGPGGQPASPAAPAAPGTPLIPPSDQPAARKAAVEKAYLYFDPGTLVNCQTPTLDPNVVELLRDPTGRLSSTAPCIWKIADTVTLRPAPPAASRQFLSLRPYLAAGWVANAFEGGIGADFLHVGDLSLGLDLRVATWTPATGAVRFGFQHLVLGASLPIFGPHIRFQGGYAFSLNQPAVPNGWALGMTLRF